MNKNDRTWTLSKAGAQWIGEDISMFYNRECYDTLLNKMKDRSRVLVIGTPGIGKTMFLQRLLVDIVERAKDTNQRIPSINYITCEKSVAKTYRLKFNGDTEMADLDSVDFELSDSVDLEHPRGITRTVLVASDKDVNYNSFDKRVGEAGEKGITLGMRLCTLEELMAMNPGMNAIEGQFCYDIVGGSARNFQRCIVPGDFSLSIVEETMLWYFGNEIKQTFSSTWGGALSVISKEFGKTKDQHYNVMNSLMRHRDDGLHPMWASKFMECLASVVFVQKEASMYNAVKDLVGTSGLGMFFECIAHRKLTANKIFMMTPLHPKNKRNVSRETVRLDLRGVKVLPLRTDDAIGTMPAKSYGICGPNFNLIDGVVQPTDFLQMTIADHHNGATDSLMTLQNFLLESDRTKHRMVFIVPKDKLKTFKYQTSLNSIQQFVLCPDDTVDEEIMHNKRPRLR